jgi:hypothetical protein
MIGGSLSGVMVSVLATGPKLRGFKPGRGDEFLRAIKISSTPSFGVEVKPKVLCRITLKYERRYFEGQIHRFLR